MFEADDEIKRQISAAKRVDSTSLVHTSQVLESHATVVMQAIDSAISGIDNADMTREKLRLLGVEHKLRGISYQFISVIREPFLTAVQQTLEERYTDHMRRIYEAFIDYLIKEIVDAYNQ